MQTRNEPIPRIRRRPSRREIRRRRLRALACMAVKTAAFAAGVLLALAVCQLPAGDLLAMVLMIYLFCK